MRERHQQSGHTILIVEDAASVRKAVARMLRFNGYTVLTAGDGHEAIEILERVPVHAMVIDLMMPGMDWDALAAEVADRWPGTAMVFMTGHTVPDQTVRVPGPLLLKPFDLPEVVAVVVRAIGGSR